METKLCNIAIVGGTVINRQNLVFDLMKSMMLTGSDEYEVVVITTESAIKLYEDDAYKKADIVTLDEVGFLNLRTWIITNQSKKQVIFVPELEHLSAHSKYTELLEFLNFVSEYGKGIGAYTIISCKNRLLERIVIKNTPLFCLFKMSRREAKELSELLNFDKSTIDKILSLDGIDYLLFERN